MFISRTLKGAELSYFTTEKELLAIVWALTNLDSFLRGSKILIRTDHQALTFLQTCHLTNARLTRWILAIQNYDHEIEYIQGKVNVATDVLSRKNVGKDSYTCRPDNEIVLASILARAPSPLLMAQFEKLSALQREDPKLKRITDRLQNSDQVIRGSYKLKEDLLYKQDPGGNERLVIPTSTALLLIQEVHEIYGHIGNRKVCKMIGEDFYVKRLNRTAKQALKTCVSCQINKHDTRGNKAPVQIIVPERPNDLLSIDFYGPLPRSTGGVRYILVTIDAFSKLVVLYPIIKANTDTVIRKIFSHYVANFGKPKRITCDHGSQFTATKWEQKLKAEGVRLSFSSIRHPQSNVVERVNRELGRFFRTFLKDKHSGWARYVNIIQNCLNETHHETTDLTPVELHFNKKPERCSKSWIHTNPPDNVKPHEEKIVLARERIRRKRQRRADNVNARIKTTPEFEIGKRVLVKANNVTDSENNRVAKFFSIYEGPYEIKARIAADTYLLIDRSTERERGRFHANDLREYYD